MKYTSYKMDSNAEYVTIKLGIVFSQQLIYV